MPGIKLPKAEASAAAASTIMLFHKLPALPAEGHSTSWLLPVKQIYNVCCQTWIKHCNAEAALRVKQGPCEYSNTALFQNFKIQHCFVTLIYGTFCRKTLMLLFVVKR